jgi:hypothetical protein
MSNPNNGGPAFPLQVHVSPGCEFSWGMNLRDYFAAQVIGPLMASDGFEQVVFIDKEIAPGQLAKFAAQTAYEIADAMIAERERNVEK